MMRATKTWARNSLILGSYLTGLPCISAQLSRRRVGPATRIVTFHKVKDLAVFQQQVHFVSSNFNVVSLADFLQGRVSADQANVVLTFDDGYRSWLEALPVLQQWKLPATFFVSSGYVDATERDRWREFCRDRLGVSAEPGLTWQDVRELSHQEGIEVGGHSLNHLSLGEVADPETVRKEIRNDKHRLEQQTGKEVRYFAYPFGQFVNANWCVAEIVREAGYQCALTMVPGANRALQNPYFLRRDCLDEVRSPLLMKAWLAGGYDPFKQALLSFQAASSGLRPWPSS